MNEGIERWRRQTALADWIISAGHVARLVVWEAMLAVFLGLVLPQMSRYNTATPPAAILIEIGWVLVFVELLVSAGAGMYRLVQTRHTATRLALLEGGISGTALRWWRQRLRCLEASPSSRASHKL